MIKSIFTIEKMVLGTCIENPRAWKFLFQHLSEENFIDVKNRAIIHAAHALIDEGKCPERHAFLAPAVGVDEKYLDKLVVFACDHTQFVECINMLKNIPEGQLQIDENIQQRADQNPIPQKSSSAVTPVNTPSSTEQCQLIEGATAIDGFFQQLKEQPIPPVATGITALDNLLGGGMINGGLYILAANTGCGKTALALQIADAVANEDRSVLFISLEMDEYQLTARRLARAAKVSANHLIMHDLSEMEYVHIKQQLPMLKQKRLVFNRPGEFTVSDIQALAGQVQNLRLVIIDYLGLLRSEPYCGNRYEATTAISNALKALDYSVYPSYGWPSLTAPMHSVWTSIRSWPTCATLAQSNRMQMVFCFCIDLICIHHQTAALLRAILRQSPVRLSRRTAVPRDSFSHPRQPFRLPC